MRFASHNASITHCSKLSLICHSYENYMGGGVQNHGPILVSQHNTAPKIIELFAVDNLPYQPANL